MRMAKKGPKTSGAKVSGAAGTCARANTGPDLSRIGSDCAARRIHNGRRKWNTCSATPEDAAWVSRDTTRSRCSSPAALTELANGRCWITIFRLLSSMRQEKRLLSIAEIRDDAKRWTDRTYLPAKQNGWLTCGLHQNDGASFTEYNAAEYLAGYASVPPIVHF